MAIAALLHQQQDAVPKIPLVPEAPSGRLDQPAGPGDVVTASFVHSEGTRDYALYVPADWQGRGLPLVVMLHGCTQDPDDFAQGTGMNALAREEGVLVLYPAQPASANPARCWNWFSRGHQGRDRGEPALLAALTESVVAAYGADPRRVYAAGLSAGGAMAAILGQAYPDVFAAIGVHSGLAHAAAGDVMSALSVMRNGPGSAVTDAPSPGATLPVIVFHGEGDTTVHPRNGKQVMDAALAQAGAATPVVEEVIEGHAALGGSLTRTIYSTAGAGWSAEYWVLHGAGHAWSGGRPEGSFTDPTGPDATREMLRFFLAHPQPLRH